MKRYLTPLCVLALLIGCTSDSADACRLRARIRAWIATRPVMSRLVVPVVPVEPDAGAVYELPPLLAPPLPMPEVKQSQEAAVQQSRATSTCPGGNCQQPAYAPRVRLFGRWR